jgi:hypothetical protein
MILFVVATSATRMAVESLLDDTPMTIYLFSARLDLFDYTQIGFDVGQLS